MAAAAAAAARDRELLRYYVRADDKPLSAAALIKKIIINKKKNKRYVAVSGSYTVINVVARGRPVLARTAAVRNLFTLARAADEETAK